ncbi:hypothetical protein PSPO01_04089 [Paraphaeosphaeria sporulosa]
MEHYVSRGCQTDIQGLCHDPALRPHPLVSPQPANTGAANNITCTPTPPDDMSLDKTRFLVHELEVTSEPMPDANPLHASQAEQLYNPNHTYNYTASTMQPSILSKRKTRPSLVARISLPGPDSGLDNENPRSPPPTEALMSPLPAANTLHAGHTPIIPGALSPLPSSGPASPGDAGLTGPLTLPPQPGDGAEDTIPLHVLDAELEKLRLAQERSASERSDSAEPEDETHEDDAAPPAAQTKENRRRSSAKDVVDGVLLKKPRMNMGAPLGQA